MRTKIFLKSKGLVKVLPFYLFTFLLLVSCADLDYTEQTTRDEKWTFEYFGEGIKNLVFDIYAPARKYALLESNSLLYTCA